MSRPFYTLDVFTGTALEGNPLAVVLDADGLSPARMQALAREFNLSETVFVLAPRDPVNSARVRIFTPARELPFAGHPTVGAAVLLAQLRAPEILARQDLALVIEEEVGPVRCIARTVGKTVRASFTLPRLPEPAGEAPPAEAVAAALHLRPEDLGFGTHAPSLVSAGVPFHYVPVRGLDAAARAWPDLTRWAGVFGETGVYVYTREVALAGSHVHARMFAPEMGMAEDPATGSAAAGLAGVLLAHEPFGDGDHTVVIEQGVEMGRPSLVTLGLEVEGGRLAGGSIGGAAVVVSRGTLEL